MPSVNEAIFDYQVAQQIRWLRLGQRSIGEILKTMNGLDDAIERVLRESNIGQGTFRRRQLEALRNQIAGVQRAWHDGTLRPFVTRTVSEVRDLAARGEEALLRRVMQPVLTTRAATWPQGIVDVVTPNVGALNALSDPNHYRNMVNGSTLGDWISQLRDNDVRRTWGRVSEGILSGETTDDIVRGVRGSQSLRYRDGVREVTRRGTATLVRTSVNHAQNAGRQLVWEANADLINGIQWVSTLDTRTTPICRSRDGKVYGLEEGPRPPAHPNCRSTTIPVTKSWEELGLQEADLPPATRASMNGQVPRETTYYEWLNRQAPDVQREAVGPTRFRMWKENGVNPERFYRDDGYTYTIDELRQRMGSDIAGVTVGDNFSTAALARSLQATDTGVAAWRSNVGDIMPEDIGRMLIAGIDELEDARIEFRAFSLEARTTLRVDIERINTSGTGYDLRMVRQFTFERGRKTVDHSFFELSAAMQNRGIGRRVLRQQFNAYQRLGVQRVELLANIDVGSYAWARYGFRPTSTADFVSTVRGRLNMLAVQNGFDDTADIYADVIRALASPEPAWNVSDLRQLVTYNGQRMALGKALLLNQRWGGYFDLDDVAAMTRFNDYVR